MNLAMRMQSKTKQEEMLSLQSPGSICSSFLLVFKDFLRSRDCAFQQCCWHALFAPRVVGREKCPIWGHLGHRARVPHHRSTGASWVLLRCISWDWSSQQEMSPVTRVHRSQPTQDELPAAKVQEPAVKGLWPVLWAPAAKVCSCS